MVQFTEFHEDAKQHRANEDRYDYGQFGHGLASKIPCDNEQKHHNREQCEVDVFHPFFFIAEYALASDEYYPHEHENSSENL